MKNAGLGIDSWKLPIFEKHLKAAGYTFKVIPCSTPDILLLAIPYTWVSELQPVIEAANLECKNAKLS